MPSGSSFTLNILPLGGVGWRVVLLTALAYGLAGCAGFWFAPINIVSWIWPASGVAFAAIWFYRQPALVGVFLGSLIIEYARTRSPLFCVLVACGSLAPAVLTIALLRRDGVDDLFDQPSHVFRFIFYAGLLGPSLSALIGAVATRLADLGSWSDFGGNALSWWIGDSIGILLFAPPLLTVSLWRELPWCWRRRFELLALCGSVLLYCAMLALVRTGVPTSLLIVPLVIWGALRFNFAVGSAVVLMVALVSMLGILMGVESTRYADTHEQLLYVQLFLLATACISLAVGATIAAQTAALKAQQRVLLQLRDSEDRFRATFEQAAVGVAMLGLDKKWLMINQRLCDILGYTHAELMAIDARQLLLEERDFKFDERALVARQNMEQYRIDKRLLSKSQTPIWCSIYATRCARSGRSRTIFFVGDRGYHRAQARRGLGGTDGVIRCVNWAAESPFIARSIKASLADRASQPIARRRAIY